MHSFISIALACGQVLTIRRFSEAFDHGIAGVGEVPVPNANGASDGLVAAL